MPSRELQGTIVMLDLLAPMHVLHAALMLPHNMKMQHMMDDHMHTVLYSSGHMQMPRMDLPAFGRSSRIHAHVSDANRMQH